MTKTQREVTKSLKIAHEVYETVFTIGAPIKTRKNGMTGKVEKIEFFSYGTMIGCQMDNGNYGIFAGHEVERTA